MLFPCNVLPSQEIYIYIYIIYIYNIYIIYIYIYIRCFNICSFSFSRPNFRSRCPLDRLNSVALVEALGHSRCHEEVTETLTGKISGTQSGCGCFRFENIRSIEVVAFQLS